MLKYLELQKEERKPETFSFGDYGGSIKYGGQPSLAGILFNYAFLVIVLPALRHVYRKSTIVRNAFLACLSSYKHGNANVSSFDNNSWARWCSASAILLAEHIHKISSHQKIYRQVMQQDTISESSAQVNHLIELYTGGVPAEIKEDPDPPPTTSIVAQPAAQAKSWLAIRQETTRTTTPSGKTFTTSRAAHCSRRLY